MYVKNGTGVLKRVLVSKPEYLKAAKINEIAKKWDYDLDLEKMAEEHAAFVRAYEENGVKVEFLPASEKRPNSVFARDFGGCVKEGYVLGRFKLPLRYDEHVDYEAKMKELKIPVVAEVKEGLFEGGDFAFLNEHTIAIGMADRSNEKGVEEIKKGLEPLGYQVIGVPVKPEYLHLDMCFNLVDDHLAVTYDLQALGNKRVMSLKQNQAVNEALAKEGMNVIELDITEILKAGGGPHCMTFPLERI